MVAAGLGTGKTRIGVEVIKRALRARALVLCPKVVREVWMDEAAKWSLDALTVMPDGSTDRRDGCIRGLVTRGEPFVCVLNYESAVRLAPVLARYSWDVLVLDESHRVKGTSSKVARLAHRLARKSTTRLLLTGTPADRPVDWFSQARVLDESIYGARVAPFYRRYCVFGNPLIPQQITGFKNLDELGARVAPYVMTVRAEDAIDLPPETDTTIPVEMSARGMRLYRQLEEEYYVEVDNVEVETENDLSKLLRLQQMTGGTMRVEGVDVSVDDRKEKALADWLADVNEPVVVVCRFVADLDAVHRAARNNSSELSGRRNNWHKWREGKSQVLAMQIRAGGVGISLTRASAMVFYSTGYSLIDMQQARGRVRRPGQERPVNYVHLVAKRTVDEVVARAHIRKDNVLAKVRAAMRRAA